MGAKFAPSYANLYMGWWEETHISADMRKSLRLYTRYIDDLLCVWKGDEMSFITFVQKLNQNELNLKFTSEYRSKTIEFLDVKLMVVDKEIQTTIFRKSCSGNTLLHATSCHPKNLVDGIPVGQFLRLRRNCSTNMKFQEQAEEMKERFLDRGYGRKIVDRAYQRARQTERRSLLSVNPMGEKKKKVKQGLLKKVPFVTRYSKQFYMVLDIVKKYIPILYADDDFHKILKGGVNSIPRRSHTLRDHLSPSMYRETNRGDQRNKGFLKVEGSHKCGSRRCITCQHMKISKEFKSTVTNTSFKIRDYINCNTSTVVYLITCLKCQKQYVGCTSRTLKRIREHLSQIKNPKTVEKSNITRHFSKCNGSDVAYFSVQGIEKVRLGSRGGNLAGLLAKRELFWIFYLHTRLQLGLNYEFDVTCFT
ncbi:uncharacterized protein LOC121394196 [Xenopus laevis]|uniref:Uncharacterized protein LOC121394196 n=1 Tax=Xenopus laevis TaxID=8355 RepID=A0A8J1KVV7_XENLA|nr:uncharacterized protein LOC121394196 [Xenopus laevis]